VLVTADKRKDPPRMDDFRIVLEIAPHLEPKHVEGLERAVHQCLIHNTLLHPPTIAIEIHSPVLAVS
jgi:putative redox protein